ncbi:unnamed protein product [Prorocentrum cordatum]|uniref:Dihydroorotate dehydrogenase catalytic domain-containing protein n=1 Tax=Prorocentrum cordatum TaxID=2364126 RepID=A0ABN9QEB1_9DINO|nr:unnamed protein product [Polarella glacialis]
MSVVGRLRPALLRGGAAASAAALGAAYYQRLPESHGDHRSAWSEGTGTRVYRTFLWPLVAQLDPEDAHLAALRAGQAWQAARACLEALKELPLAWLVLPAPSQSVPSGPALRQALFGGRLCFESPVGLAAGFDKNGLLVPLYRLGALPGLGFAEVGSVSAQPAAGNPRPRCWRVPSDEAVINFMGLNNDGAEAVAERLAAGAARGGAPVGVNIAKTHSPSILGDEAVQDFVASFRRLARHADFVVLNVSCPNTTEASAAPIRSF